MKKVQKICKFVKVMLKQTQYKQSFRFFDVIGFK